MSSEFEMGIHHGFTRGIGDGKGDSLEGFFSPGINHEAGALGGAQVLYKHEDCGKDHDPTCSLVAFL